MSLRRGKITSVRHNHAQSVHLFYVVYYTFKLTCVIQNNVNEESQLVHVSEKPAPCVS